MHTRYKVGQIGHGFVGSALNQSFLIKGVHTRVYDKYKDMGTFDDILDSDILFLCLPTPYVAGYGFDLHAILSTCKKLEEKEYGGIVVIKSTVEPGITEKLNKKFKTLRFCHNPEFLSAKTAFEDFHNQKHIVIGHTVNNYNSKSDAQIVAELYKTLYSDAEISICESTESEAMKLFANNFYAMKVQIFNEFYFLCQKMGADYENVKELMIKNNWINPMHTVVPGGDGQVSYGGFCFPKDTNALCHMMKSLGSPHQVLEACIKERNEIREEKWK